MMADREGVRPDEILPPERGSVQARRLMTDAVLMLPNIVKLVARLLRDPRVPRRSKIALGMAAAYVASPIDLIPDPIPVLGYLDDLIIAPLGIAIAIKLAPNFMANFRSLKNQARCKEALSMRNFSNY